MNTLNVLLYYLLLHIAYYLGLPRYSRVKNQPAIQETGDVGLIREILWRRKWQSTPVFLPRKFHGQRTVHEVTKSQKQLSNKVLARTPTHTQGSCCLLYVSQ